MNATFLCSVYSFSEQKITKNVIFAELNSMLMILFSKLYYFMLEFPYHAFINTLASGCFQGFLEKKRLNARGFAREYLHSCSGYEPGRSIKRCGKSSSLHSKKNFIVGGCGFVMSDVTSGGLFGHVVQLHLALGTNR